MDVCKIRPEVICCQIFDYVSDRKRCLMEEEEVYKGGYMVARGIMEEKAGHMVHTLRVQTCGSRGKPRRIS